MSDRQMLKLINFAIALNSIAVILTLVVLGDRLLWWEVLK